MPTSDKGFTVVELLISMAIVGIVLTGILRSRCHLEQILPGTKFHRRDAG